MEKGLRRVEFLDPLTEQEVELSLGLSIGGSSCKKVTASPSVTGSGGESVDPQRRREANALHRQCRERDREAREEEADQRSIQIPEIACRPNPNPNHIPMMMPVYMPMTNGFGFPYVVPCWAPTIPSESEKNVFHPVACRSFPPFPNPNLNHNPNPEHISNLNPLVVFHPEKIGGKSIAIKLAPSSSDSPGSSSSGFSDYQSGSLRGRSSGSSETTRSHSSSTVAEKSKGQAIQEALSKPIIPAPAPAMVTENAARVDQMPCVSTTGPDGRRIKGFLHRYTKGEVSIVCVCHGSSFSPAAFVRHAGGTEGSHPLRQIVVVPS